MLLNKAIVIGLEGPHSSGKTTLAEALTSLAATSGVRSRRIAEQIRESPFFQSGEAVGSWAESHAFAQQIVQELLAARDHDLLICDRTILSALAYWRVRVPSPSDQEQRLFDGFFQLAKAYLPLYDVILYLSKYHRSAPDRFRDADLERTGLGTDDFWIAVDQSFRSLFEDLGVTVIDVPSDLSSDHAADWVASRIEASGLWPGGSRSA